MRWHVLLLGFMLAASVTCEVSERPLKGEEITALLADATVRGSTNGKAWEQTFHKAGQTFYSIDGNTTSGFWKVQGDQYCSQWPPREVWSCYAVTAEGDRITFVSSSGMSYPCRIMGP